MNISNVVPRALSRFVGKMSGVPAVAAGKFGTFDGAGRAKIYLQRATI